MTYYKNVEQTENTNSSVPPNDKAIKRENNRCIKEPGTNNFTHFNTNIS